MTIQIMRCRCSVAALSVALWFAGMPAFAQSSANETTLFQARIKEAASNLADRPAFKNLSAADRKSSWTSSWETCCSSFCTNSVTRR